MNITIIYSQDSALFIIKPVGKLSPGLFDLQACDWSFVFED